MGMFAPRAQRLYGLLLVLACVAVLMGADRRVGRVPAATGELTLLSGASGTFDVVAANADLPGFELLPVRNGALGTTSVLDGVIHYSAHGEASGVDRVVYQLLTDSGQRRLGELRVHVLDAQAEVAMRVNLVIQDRSGVSVELREGDTVVAAGVTRRDGVVDLTVPAGWAGEAMLTLHAEGKVEFGSEVTWMSVLGSVRQLRVAAAGGRLEASAWPALRLGAMSTAFSATLLSIDPEAAVDEAAAMRAAAGVDPDRLILGATVMDVIASGERNLPWTHDSTWELLSDARELDRMQTTWQRDLVPALSARVADPAKSAGLPQAPYEAWFWEPSANGLALGEGYGMVLGEGGEGEYFTRQDLDDSGLQWHPHEGDLRVVLNHRVEGDNGGVGRWCTLADGSKHDFLVLRTYHRDTMDLRRMHAYAGIEFIMRRWHFAVTEALHSPVPEDCDARITNYVVYMPDYAITQPNPEFFAVAGPARSVPQTVLLGLDDSGGQLVTGLLDLAQDTLVLEGFAPGIDVHEARAGRITFDAFAEGGAGPVRFELQQLREGLGGAAAWSVVRREAGVFARGWVSAGIEPQPLRADFDWNGHWINHGTWSKTGTLGHWRNEERWGLDAEGARATRFGKPTHDSDWTLLPDSDEHFVIEDGAAVRRLYRVAGGPGLVECPPNPPMPCTRYSEHRQLPLAEVRDAFGPGHDLVFVMHEAGLHESQDGEWASYRRFVDAWVRDPDGVLHQAHAREARRSVDVRNASVQEQ